LRLLDIVEVGSSAALRRTLEVSWHSTGHSWHTTWHSTSSSVDSGDDWVVDSLEFFLLLLILFNRGIRVALVPLLVLLGSVSDLFLFVISELVLELLVINGGSDLVDVLLVSVLSLNLFGELVVLGLELLSLSDKSVDLLLGESTLVVSDGDVRVLS